MMTKEENILLQAEKLFAEKGFDGTSTREIAKAADINISMISYYFGSKEKLLEKIFEYRMSQGLEFSNAVLERTDIHAWGKLNLLINKYIERVKTLKDFYLILQRENINLKNPSIINYIKDSKKKYFVTYQNIIKEGQESGIFKKSPKVEFIHSTISGTLFTAMNSFPFYQEFLNGNEKYELEYYKNLEKHLTEILKYLLGYEENL